jgi:hypothetical protein
MKTHRGIIVGLAAAAVACTLPSTAGAALVRTPAAPGVSAAYGVRTDTARVRPQKRRTVLVRVVRIVQTDAAVVRVDCPRACPRRAGAPPVLTHPKADTLVRRLNVLLSGKRTLRFRVIVPSATSRYLTLGLRRGKIAIVAAGCLGAKGKPAPCPVPAPPVQPDVSGPGGGAPELPVALPSPGANPVGALTSVQRLDNSRVRVVGWARDADDPGSPVTVRAFTDGTFVGAAKADVQRTDMGAHGYDFVAATDELSHSICVRGLNLAGGVDALLGACRPVLRFADFNGDGRIGCADKDFVLANYGQQNAGYSSGDLNGDGLVDIVDLSIVLNRFDSGETCP